MEINRFLQCQLTEKVNSYVENDNEYISNIFFSSQNRWEDPYDIKFKKIQFQISAKYSF